MKIAALPRFARAGDTAAVRDDNFARNREPEAGADLQLLPRRAEKTVEVVRRTRACSNSTPAASGLNS